MKKILHRATTRGTANYGWLQAKYSFSFANFFDPNRIQFGKLRVLNDDIIAPGMGFGKHPHNNMEIISIPLEGDLEHKDSMGNVTIIKEGDVQIMSAGTGITHSEYNKNEDKEVQFLQIWIFPKEKNVSPRYDQISIRDLEKDNKFYQVLSPNKEDDGVWIHQDAWFHMGKFSAGNTDNYKVKRPNNGVYIFVIEGEVNVNGETLTKRDGMGIWNTDSVDIEATNDTRVLLIEIPMN